MTENDNGYKVAMMTHAVYLSFDQAAAAFKQAPVGPHWEALEQAMRARQHWHNLSLDQKCALADKWWSTVGIGQWVESLALLWDERSGQLAQNVAASVVSTRRSRK